MQNWFKTMEEALWLRPDETGEEEAQFIKSALHLGKGHTVLDAPSGAGRISYHLSQAGLEVTCIDLRKEFILRAQRRFKKAGLPGAFTVVDLRHMILQNPFHGIFNWGGSFGYFDDTENANLVQTYARALRPGGRLLIQQPNRENLLRNFAARIQRSDRLIVLNRWDSKRQRVVSRRLLDGKEDPNNRSSMRLYTPTQMKDLLRQADLTVESIYGSPSGQMYRRSAPEMIMVGRKG